MARRLKDGRHIFTASEVGAFVVCPEAWRLRSIERTKTAYSPELEQGSGLHDEWVRYHDDATFLLKQVRLAVLLVILAGLIFISRNL